MRKERDRHVKRDQDVKGEERQTCKMRRKRKRKKEKRERCSSVTTFFFFADLMFSELISPVTIFL